MKQTLFLALLVAACAHTIKRDPADPSVRTITMETGRLADDNLYGERFMARAEAECHGPYVLLERTRTPSTLAGQELPAANFYWVVRCSPPGGLTP